MRYFGIGRTLLLAFSAVFPFTGGLVYSQPPAAQLPAGQAGTKQLVPVPENAENPLIPMAEPAIGQSVALPQAAATANAPASAASKLAPAAPKPALAVPKPDAAVAPAKAAVTVGPAVKAPAAAVGPNRKPQNPSPGRPANEVNDRPLVPMPEGADAPEPSSTEPLMTQDVFLPDDLPAASTPRGTLGVTYFRHTHPVPEDKHPRLGMLAVRDKQRFRIVVVRGMGGLRLKNGIWLFESDRPLDPGASHIVCIEAKDHMMDVDAITKRYVRLIPGRIVYLDFSDPSED